MVFRGTELLRGAQGEPRIFLPLKSFVPLRASFPLRASSPSRASIQRSDRTEREIQVVVLKSERALQLRHSLFQLHQGVAEALDLVLGERPAIHATESLLLEESPHQLNDR